MNKNYKWYMFVYYFMSLIFIISYLYLQQKSYCYEWIIIDMFDLQIVLSLSYTYYNMIFLFTVCSVFTSVYHYSIYYMEGEMNIKRFLFLLISFVVSMMILICSGNLFTSLIGWDGLGVSSMLLIMFYCSNASLKASMYTFVINRIGDCFFLILIFSLMCKYPSTNLLMHNLLCLKNNFFICLLILLAITKSAQVPFSSWLTKAMEAPTPVSSLVHSSTLVTAGIYILFLYQDIWKESKLFTFMLSILSLSTIFIASSAGLVEMDLKKIVAYSTLSQLGFIMFTFSLSLFHQGFFHLIMHAFFKALMFMGAGYLIHNSSGWQDIRYITLTNKCSPNILKIFCTAMLSLCGMPFLSGFYSKDMILDSFMKSNYSFFFFIILIISFMFTVFYSFRVCWYLMESMKKILLMNDDSLGMINSMLYLLTLSCIMGSSVMWTLYPNFPPMNSPKIIMIMFLIIILTLFWVFPNVNKTLFFLKTNMYLYVIVNLVVYKFMTNIQKLMWFGDLLGVVGMVLKKLPKEIMFKGMSLKKELFLMYSKEFFLFFFMMLSLIIFL
uniref:NADH:ubiquinone reductase (H(+)-translocating) n=1 Tax=Osborniella crotophagae TaxID=1912107 RepID=A0A7T1M862_9NEOP|nr:NADH dehydrogenase subunit 5 [Osborniella crotophagae]